MKQIKLFALFAFLLPTLLFSEEAYVAKVFCAKMTVPENFFTEDCFPPAILHRKDLIDIDEEFQSWENILFVPLSESFVIFNSEFSIAEGEVSSLCIDDGKSSYRLEVELEKVEDDQIYFDLNVEDPFSQLTTQVALPLGDCLFFAHLSNTHMLLYIMTVVKEELPDDLAVPCGEGEFFDF